MEITTRRYPRLRVVALVSLLLYLLSYCCCTSRPTTQGSAAAVAIRPHATYTLYRVPCCPPIEYLVPFVLFAICSKGRVLIEGLFSPRFPHSFSHSFYISRSAFIFSLPPHSGMLSVPEVMPSVKFRKCEKYFLFLLEKKKRKIWGKSSIRTVLIY